MTDLVGTQLVFVGGPPRAGNTLVQNVLDSHPRVAGGPEFDLLPDIMALRRALHDRIRTGRIDQFIDHDAADVAVRAFVASLLGPYGRARGATVISEKTPWNVLVASELLDCFPDAKFIFCVRDPVAIVESMLRVGDRAATLKKSSPYFTRDVSAAAYTLVRCMDAGFEAKRKYPERVLLVRFEDAVREPAQTFRELCAFIEVPFDEAMLRPSQVAHDGERQLDGVWYDRSMFYRDPDASVLGQPSRLTDWERSLVAVATEPLPYLESLGYEQPRLGLQHVLARGWLSSEHLAQQSVAWLSQGFRRVGPLREVVRRARLRASRS